MEEVKVPGFMMYYEWREDFSQMTPEETQIIVMAALNGFKEETISNDRFMQSIYLKMKNAAQRGIETYLKRKEAGSKNGKLGGRPRKEQTAKPETEPITDTNTETDTDRIGFVRDIYEKNSVIFRYSDFERVNERYPQMIEYLMNEGYSVEEMKDIYEEMKLYYSKRNNN